MENETMADYHVVKLGRDGTRIWLEGARLKAAAFEKGRFVSREWGKRKLVLRVVTKAEADKLERRNKGKVSGSEERPIIDITGDLLAETFKGASTVDVSYANRMIVITA
jgi:hypothetical protein